MRNSPSVTLLCSLACAMATLFVAHDMPPAQKHTLAVLSFMVSAWILEGIPFGAVALVPLFAFPMLGVASLANVARAYATPTVALFLGGFVLALAVERAGLHQRMAHFLLKRVGATPRVSCLVFLGLSGFLSMWMSNTSVALLLVPLAVRFGQSSTNSVGLPNAAGPLGHAFALAVAYGANLGGIVTPIGSPPNGMLAAALLDHGSAGVSFLNWMLKMFPLWLLLIPLAWLTLLIAFRKAFGDAASCNLGSKSFPSLGLEAVISRSTPWTSREKRVFFVAVATVVSWWVSPLLPIPSRLVGETDALIALCAAFALFTLPAGPKEQGALLEWEDTKSLSWNILFLFGAGLALSQAMQSSGLSALMASSLSTSGFQHDSWHFFASLMGVLFATEIVSNTALAATLLPIVLNWESSLGLPELTLSLPVTVAVSLAFMMPIATPPNAIAYGLAKVPLVRMLMAGLAMNVLSGIVLTVWFAA
jgi:sodium-dependent dicarboxylate transporter 2/3/5